uniref:Putative secreted protein n=1 Tax=Ixodes ricinus TaxID=34613 RepID=A0A6B0V090_IXORI
MAMGVAVVAVVSVVTVAVVAAAAAAAAMSCAVVATGSTGADWEVVGRLMGGCRERPRAVPEIPNGGGPRSPSALWPSNVWVPWGGTISMWFGGAGTPMGTGICGITKPCEGSMPFISGSLGLTWTTGGSGIPNCATGGGTMATAVAAPPGAAMVVTTGVVMAAPGKAAIAATTSAPPPPATVEGARPGPP